VDFNKVFSPVIHYETVQILLALSALKNWYITGLDVKSAFLYGKLDEEIYMRQLQGFIAEDQEHKVLRLKRSIYGLKQAALSWWKAVRQTMKQMGFVQVQSDAGLFVLK
jgi:hypothetical protein